VRPTRPELLHMISGVGEVKLRDYGPAVLDLVARLSQELGLSTDNPVEANAASPAVVPRASLDAAEWAFPHFREGKSIAEVAQLLGRADSTVREYLCAFIHDTRPDRIDAWVDQVTQERIRSASRVHGSQRLKPIFLALNQEVPYDAIRIVLTHLNVRTDLTARGP
jgi:ATP-dependent DNA helicase RecQ